jgi:hypothetical protein
MSDSEGDSIDRHEVACQLRDPLLRPIGYERAQRAKARRDAQTQTKLQGNEAVVVYVVEEALPVWAKATLLTSTAVGMIYVIRWIKGGLVTTK